MELDPVGELLTEILKAEAFEGRGYAVLERALEVRYLDGDAHGYHRGFAEGEKSGWHKGWGDGYSDGYNEGYEQAADDE